jgi:hypothetical protein
MIDKPIDAGAPEDEITPEMIEAGTNMLWRSGAVEHPTELDRELIRKIYLAMRNA